jgi:hypothetical protein
MLEKIKYVVFQWTNYAGSTMIFSANANLNYLKLPK